MTPLVIMTAVPAVADTMATGSYTGNDQAGRTITGLGFQPDVVIIKGNLAASAVCRTSTMTPGLAKSMADDVGPLPNLIESLDADGFTVGSAFPVNLAGVRYEWVAFDATAGEISVGSYAGDGSDNRIIGGSGFRPTFVMVLSAGPHHPWMRTDVMPQDLSLPFHDGGPVSNRIQDMKATGFEVGSDADVNGAGVTFHYVAWKGQVGNSSVGWYDGNGSDNRAITGLGLRPEYLIVHEGTANIAGIHRSDSQGTTDAGLSFGFDANLPNTIQEFLPDGFEVGTSSRVNESGKRYYFFVLGALPGSSGLALSKSVSNSGPVEGETIRYTIALTNEGPDIATGIQITDILPLGVTYSGASTSLGSFASASGVWTLGTLPVGATATLLIDATVDPGTQGSVIINTAAVTAMDQIDPTPTNNTDTATITIVDPTVTFRVLTGTYTGNGVDGRRIGGMSFRPSAVIVKGDANRAAVWRSSTMAGNRSKLLVGNTAEVSDRIQNFVSDGFLVGTTPEVNETGVAYSWIAFEAEPGVLRVGTYMGNGADNRSITGVGFQPDWVLVSSESGEMAYHRPSSLAGDLSLPFDNGNVRNDRIQALELDGFQIGRHTSVNELGVDFHYLAIKGIPGVTSFGSYVGDGLDDRELPVLGFAPDYVIVQSDAGQRTVHRPRALGPADESMFFDTQANDVDLIQALRDDGFQVGQAQEVNHDGDTHHWMAFRIREAPVDLALSMSVDYPNPLVYASTTFTLEVLNEGPGRASGITISDVVPPGVTVLRAVPSQGVYDPGTGVWTVGQMTAGNVATLAISVDIDPGSAGQTITNTASLLTTDQSETDPSNNTASSSITVGALSPRPRMMSGTYVGNGSDDRAIIGLGFSPDFVLIKGDVAFRAVCRTSTMPGDMARTLDNDDFPAPDRIQSLDADGFTVGTAPEVNQSGVRYNWIAFDATVGGMSVGTYVGNDLDNRDIGGTGFQPEYILILSEGNDHSWQRFGAMTGDTSIPFRNEEVLPNHIQDLNPDGFQVGTDNKVNDGGVTYHYAVWNALPGLMNTGVFTGDATDGRDITGVGFRPEHVMLKSATRRHGLHRAASLEDGDHTQSFRDQPNTADAIQAVLPDGFQVGTAPEANELTAGIYWVAFATPGPISDIAVDNEVHFATPPEGDDVVYTVTAINQGPHTAYGMGISDPLPPGLTFVSAITTQGDYNALTGTWSAGTIAAGSTHALTLRARVDPGTGGSTIVMTAGLVTQEGTDPNGFNDSASVDITVDDLQVLGMRILTGTYVGDGTGDRIIGGLGFQPDLVVVKGETLQSAYSRTSTMDFGLSRSMVDDLFPLPDRILSFQADGFSVGGSAEVNYSGVTYHWSAFKAAPGTMTVGTYLGDGIDNRSISGVGFRPDYVVVLSELDDYPWARSSVMVGDMSIPFRNAGPASDRIQGFETDGFQIGATDRINSPGARYHYVAWNGIPGRVKSGYHLGNGLDNRNITEPGFPPEYVMLRAENAVPAVHRTVALGGGDTTLHFDDLLSFSNGIQALLPDGFQVGTDATVNGNGKIIYWTVFGNSGTDLALAMSVDNPNPREGGSVTYTLVVNNLGPMNATGLEITDLLPPGLVYVGDDPSQGAYTSATGKWVVGAMVSGTADTLRIQAEIGPGTAGSTLINTATITALDQEDLVLGNNIASTPLVIFVPSVDLAVQKTVNLTWPREGDPIRYTVNVVNLGPEDGTGIAITDLLPDAVTFQDATTSQGGYAAATGLWTVGGLADGEAAWLVINAIVNAGTAGDAIVNTAAITASDRPDPVPGNNAGIAVSTVLDPLSNAIVLDAVPDPSGVLLPGGEAKRLIRIDITNTTISTRTLSGVTFVNRATGPGTPAQLDASWETLSLFREEDGELVAPELVVPGPAPTGAFATGTLVFEDLDIPIEIGETVRLVLVGGAALGARDGDALGVAVVGPSDLTFDDTVDFDATWPLTGPTYLVDGLVSEQITLYPVDPSVFTIGSVRSLALEFRLPGNGYDADVLSRLNIVNNADPIQNSAVANMEAWLDDGDGAFSAATDTRLGAFVLTGDRWELTGLARPVPASGVRIFVTVDIPIGASEGSMIQLGLPDLPDVGIGMVSGNDGPIDQPVINPYVQSVAQGDRVILTPGLIGPAATFPGQENVPLLHLIATNTYPTDRRLTGLTVQNLIQGREGAGPSELDAELTQLVLRLDGDNDGVLDDFVTDPILRTSTFVNGRALFTGLSWTVHAFESRHLFVTGDVSPSGATDGDVIAVAIGGLSGVSFANPVSVVAAWPLDSGARWTVDGMVAAQLGISPVPPATLAAGDGPHLALDLTLPANGYLTDELNGLRLTNLGTAGPADLASVKLWRDGGDGVFSPGSGDDTLLGPMVWIDDAWRSPSLVETIPVDGLRLFAGVTVSTFPTDSATVRLAVPVDGVTVASSNDGPIDARRANPNTVLLSTAPVLASLGFDRTISTTGQVVTVRMTVRNVSLEDVVGLTPSPLVADGGGALTPASGPTPPTMSLPAGQTSTFTWTYVAAGTGTVSVRGDAAGTGAVSGLPRGALTSSSDEHRIVRPASGADLFAVANMPFSINRGQADVVPMTLTLVNPRGADEAAISLQSLRIRLEDETGAPIVPSEQLTRVVVSEGANVYLNKTSLETSGSEIDLTLASPAVISGTEPVSLGIRMDISLTALSPTFRVVIDEPGWFTAIDAVSGAGVPVELQEGDYPILSGLGRLVLGATELSVGNVALPAQAVGTGQTDVSLLEITLENVGEEGFSSDVNVGGFGLMLVGASGSPLMSPADILQTIRVRDDLQTYAVRSVSAADDTTIVVSLSQPIAAPVNTPMRIRLIGEIPDDASPGAFRVRLRGSDEFQAWDATSGSAVQATYPGTVEGPIIDVESTATALMARGTAELPSSLPIGAREVTALQAVFTHPGAAGTAAIEGRSIQLRFRDGARNPMDPAPIVDAFRIFWNDAQIGAIDNPTSPEGMVTISLNPFTLDAGESGILRLDLDVETGAPESSFEIVIAASGIDVVDANVGQAVEVLPDLGAELPITSGVSRLEPPADRLTVAWRDRMPAVIAGGPDALPVATLSLTNPAIGNVSGIAVTSITLRAADRGRNEIALGAAVTRVTSVIDGEPWASTGTVNGDDMTATLTPDAPLVIPASGAAVLELRVELRADPTVESFRLGLGSDDITVAQPDGALLEIRVEPEAGTVFPFWTESGNFTALSLEDSYANFPNPFAAGREATSFVYWLRQAATVSLRIYSARGEPVLTVLSSAERPAGLYQSDTWDGRNGRGNVVRSGVYVAQIDVRYQNGKSESIRRKVAVVR